MHPHPQRTYPRPTSPTRDPHAAGFVEAVELADGTVAPADADGNPSWAHAAPAPETQAQDDIPKGTVHEFELTAADSAVYPRHRARPGTSARPIPADPAKLVVSTSRPAPWTRKVAVFVPTQYEPDTAAPFIVAADGPDPLLFTTLDNLIAQKRVPVMIAISTNGGGDAQGSQRGLEYDTMSGKFAEFIETEVLPRWRRTRREAHAQDPTAARPWAAAPARRRPSRWPGTTPSGTTASLSYSGTFVNQQWPFNPETPAAPGTTTNASSPNSPRKPIRIWMHVGDRDLYNPNVMRDDMHDWVAANQRMAKVLRQGLPIPVRLRARLRPLRRSVREQTLPQALEWVWRPSKIQ